MAEGEGETEEANESGGERITDEGGEEEADEREGGRRRHATRYGMR